ncbi:MAG: glutamyl-tRNA reductase [Chloroflexi bacterium]|nr:glutamyl-tRNA reductase [Chloroflexota bacterium]
MIIVAVGLSHRTAPVEVREKVAIGEAELPAALEQLKKELGHGLILSTCNRTEIYTLAGHLSSGARMAAHFLAEQHHIFPETLSSHLYSFGHEEASRHLFRVTAGLESMILGETEILGQVRRAMEVAEEAGTLNLPLLNLFQQAIRVGRRGRAETAIAQNAVSVSSAAVELAKGVLGDLGQRTVLVVGAGEAGKLATMALSARGAGRILVTNRSPQKARELAATLGGTTVPFSKLGEVLRDVDIVVSATSSPGFVLGPAKVKHAMEQRESKQLCLIDIAVPRDIDPGVKEIKGVHLYDIDDLESVSEAGLRERAQEASKVEAIVEAEVAKFMRWWHELDVVPVVRALRNEAEAIREREYERTMRQLHHLGADDLERIEIMTKAIVNKVLHHPVTLLKERGNGHGYADMVRELFQLGKIEEHPGYQRLASPSENGRGGHG